MISYWTRAEISDSPHPFGHTYMPKLDTTFKPALLIVGFSVKYFTCPMHAHSQSLISWFNVSFLGHLPSRFGWFTKPSIDWWSTGHASPVPTTLRAYVTLCNLHSSSIHMLMRLEASSVWVGPHCLNLKSKPSKVSLIQWAQLFKLTLKVGKITLCWGVETSDVCPAPCVPSSEKRSGEPIFEFPQPYHHNVVRTNVIALSIVLRVVHAYWPQSLQEVSSPPFRLVVSIVAELFGCALHISLLCQHMLLSFYPAIIHSPRHNG